MGVGVVHVRELGKMADRGGSGFWFDNGFIYSFEGILFGWFFCELHDLMFL